MRLPSFFRSPTPYTGKWSGIAGLAIALFAVLFVMLELGPLRQLELMSYDLMLKSLGRRPADHRVLIVDVDEASLARYGQWPWPRDLVARMLETLHQGRPRVVGIDILFAEQDRSSLGFIRRELLADLGVMLDISALPPEVVDRDKALARTLQHGSFYLGVMFRFGEKSVGETHLPAPPLRVTQLSRKNSRAVPYPAADGVVATLADLSNSATGVGFVNVLADRDGVIRRAPLLIRYNDVDYPSLALAACIEYLGQSSVVVETGPEGIISFSLGSMNIPVDQQGNIAVKFRGPSKTYTTVSAADVLDGKIAAEIFLDKMIFVGASAEGLMDNHPTPFDRHFPGVEVHASVAGTILGKDYVGMPAWTLGVRAVATFLAVLAALFFVTRCSTLVGGGAMILLLFLIPAAALLVFSRYDIFISPASSMVAYVISFSLLALARFRTEELLEKRRKRELAAAQDCALVGLASLAETRDSETGNHIRRTQKYILILAEYLARQKNPAFRLTAKEIDLLVKSSPLHDVGKVGVPDRILLKPGPLTESEFEEMKKHAVYGAEALARAEAASNITDEASFLRTAREIALTHHEKWDGSGYPQGLTATQIPVSGRLMALADVYDALVSVRIYKPAMSHREAAAIITEGRGTHFDPAIVDAFEALADQFSAIAEAYSDEKQTSAKRCFIEC